MTSLRCIIGRHDWQLVWRVWSMHPSTASVTFVGDEVREVTMGCVVEHSALDEQCSRCHQWRHVGLKP